MPGNRQRRRPPAPPADRGGSSGKPRINRFKRLPNNKSPLKFLLPLDSYLEEIRIGEVDLPFLILVAVLLVFGVVMMYSASYAWAIHAGEEPNYYFKKQLFFIALGLGAMALLASKIFDYHILNNRFICVGFYAVCALLMVLVHVPGIGISDAGAARWIRVTSTFRFQPSEFMKLAMIMLLAYVMANKKYNMTTIQHGILLNGLIMGITAILTILQRHISATIIIFAIALVMINVCGTDSRHFIGMCIVGIILVGIAALALKDTGIFDYIYDRFNSMFHTFEDEYRDEAWQTRNSLIAIGSGGVFGLGLGNSRQKFLYLPESHNDFVFAIVCEELGFVGASVVIILFLMLIFRGFRIAENAPDKFGMMLTTGLVFQIGIQALLNIGVVTNAIPNTGISLPFFSYGGTAIILQLVEMGLVLNISRQSIPRREKPANTAEELHKIQEAKNRLNH